MMRSIIVVLILSFLVLTSNAADYRYSIGPSGGVVWLTGGKILTFKPNASFGGNLGISLGEKWILHSSLSFGKLSHDTTKAGTADFGSFDWHKPVDFKFTRAGISLDHLLLPSKKSFNISLGFGGGALIWKMNDPNGDSTYKVENKNGQMVNFSATELYLSTTGRMIIHIDKQWSLITSVGADYLTGGGAVFAAPVNKARDRWMLNASIAIQFHLLPLHKAEKWPSDSNWTQTQPKVKPTRSLSDSDGDGVPDDLDRCPHTPRGAVVDASGCPVDSDKDGVPDGLDDCPNTPATARGKIDIDGCPIDSDCDGYPDYADSCPNNQIGALVDPNGCPVDSDKDGIADGLDDCPNTLPGIQVDNRGCIDMSMFAEPMVLHIDYDPGGFEVDSRNKQRLEQLARVLTYVPDLKLEINAYTDSQGQEQINQQLSNRRALRVREYLIAYGVSAERMNAVGRGSTKPVATNETAEGRAKNRRVEILFTK